MTTAKDESLSELQLASLVGLDQEEEIPLSTATATTKDEDAELLRTNPRNNLSQRPSWSNPLLKAGTVMLGCFFIACVGYLFLGSLMKPLPQSKAKQEPQFPLPDEITPEQTQAINGEVALGDQVRAFEKQAEQEDSAKPKPPSNTPLARKREALPVTPPPPRPITAPRPVTPPLVPVTRQAPPPRPITARPSAIRQPPPTTNTVPKPSPTPVVNPIVQWQQAAQLGSFGGALTQETAIADSTLDQSTSTVDPAIEATVLQERSQRMFLAGSSARAFLQNHLQWKPGQSEVKAVAILSDPMVGADGEVLLPAGTPLVVQLDVASELPQLSVVSATILINGRAEEIAFPNAALLVQSTGDRPLVAQQIELKGKQPSQTDWGRVAIGSATDVLSGNDIDVEGIWRNASRTTNTARGSVAYFMPAKTPIVVFVSQSFAIAVSQGVPQEPVLSN